MVNLEKIWIGKNRQLSPTIGQIADCHVCLLYCQVPKPFSSSTFVYLNCFRKHRIYICKLFLFLQILEKCESPPSHSHQQVMCRTCNLSELFYKHPRYAVNMRQTLLFRRIKNPLCVKKKMLKDCCVISLLDKLWGRLPLHRISISVDGGLPCKDILAALAVSLSLGSLKGEQWTAASVALELLFFCSHLSVQIVWVNTVTLVELLMSLCKEMLKYACFIIS